jgi:hypothetical protein
MAGRLAERRALSGCSGGAAACIPDVQFVTIPGRHLAIAQQPEAFNAALLQFLSKSGSRPKP